MIKSHSEKCLAQNEANISVGVHVGSSLIKVKDTHLMNNNQPVAEILCWRLSDEYKNLCIIEHGLIDEYGWNPAPYQCLNIGR